MNTRSKDPEHFIPLPEPERWEEERVKCQGCDRTYMIGAFIGKLIVTSGLCGECFLEIRN